METCFDLRIEHFKNGFFLSSSHSLSLPYNKRYEDRNEFERKDVKVALKLVLLFPCDSKMRKLC